MIGINTIKKCHPLWPVSCKRRTVRQRSGARVTNIHNQFRMLAKAMPSSPAARVKRNVNKKLTENESKYIASLAHQYSEREARP